MSQNSSFQRSEKWCNAILIIWKLKSRRCEFQFQHRRTQFTILYSMFQLSSSLILIRRLQSSFCVCSVCFFFSIILKSTKFHLGCIYLILFSCDSCFALALTIKSVSMWISFLNLGKAIFELLELIFLIFFSLSLSFSLILFQQIFFINVVAAAVHSMQFPSFSMRMRYKKLGIFILIWYGFMYVTFV